LLRTKIINRSAAAKKIVAEVKCKIAIDQRQQSGRQPGNFTGLDRFEHQDDDKRENPTGANTHPVAIFS